MIRRMILINSANFDLVDIDLSKDVFFLGDNASGKTTTTRAIHYLYNAEGRQLGIPSDKDSFEIIDNWYIDGFDSIEKLEAMFDVEDLYDMDIELKIYPKDAFNYL